MPAFTNFPAVIFRGKEQVGGFVKNIGGGVSVYTLPETNSSHLKMDGWNTCFLLGRPIFRGYVSFRECISIGNLETPAQPTG